LNDGWQWTTQYGVQRLKSDDRLTFAYGYNGGPPGAGYLAGVITPQDQTTQLTDQFTRAGRYEIDDFRSDNERRLMDVVQTEISGSTEIHGFKNHLTLGMLRQRQLDRLPPMQTWNPAGEGNVFGGSSASPSPEPYTANTNRSEYSNEFTVKDRIELTTQTTAWMGLRHVEFNRLSTQNDGSQQRRYEGSMNLPWVGISKSIENKVIYASHGHGIEQFIAPNSFLWLTQAGQQLGVARSRQTEFGVRHIAPQGSVGWNAAVFQIDRPLAYDEKLSGALTGTFKRHLDGTQTHQGLELGANLSAGQWRLGSQAQWLYAKISGVEETQDSVGSTPLNVPKFVLRGMAEYRYTSVPGLRTGLRVSHEGQRNVTEDGNVMLPSWTTLDASAHYDTKVNNVASTWTLAIDNLEDKRYWRESPKQFGHYYLYPGAPRTLRATVQFRL
jgi:iron complex outermembrane receptor protein